MPETADARLTEEEAFQLALDADPADRTTRLVFADWLLDRGDPRGPGYAELARLGKVPHGPQNGWGYCTPTATYTAPPVRDCHRLPVAWVWAMRRRCALDPDASVWCSYRMDRSTGDDLYELTRREAEDCAALAYADWQAEQGGAAPS